jgi:hypothetical protein
MLKTAIKLIKVQEGTKKVPEIILNRWMELKMVQRAKLLMMNRLSEIRLMQEGVPGAILLMIALSDVCNRLF